MNGSPDRVYISTCSGSSVVYDLNKPSNNSQEKQIKPPARKKRPTTLVEKLSNFLTGRK